jgi:N4-gp56 family major capsid protein
MADTYTGVVALDDVVQTAFDRMAYYALREELYFDAVADVKPTRQSMPGDVVQFTKVADLSVATATLSESVDVDAQALSSTNVQVTLLEKGNAVLTTAKLRGTSFVEVDPIVANVIGYNAGVSLDTIAAVPLTTGNNVHLAGGASSEAAITANDLLTAHDVRVMRSKLRAASVPTIGGGLYVAFIHPDVTIDLREESDAAGWREPHTMSDPTPIWNGQIGAFEQFRFIESAREPLGPLANAGSGNVDNYRTLFLGRQSLAKAWSSTDGNGPFPQVVIGPITDKLRRNVPIGWKWLGGYNNFRQEALWRFVSASSIGANA